VGALADVRGAAREALANPIGTEAFPSLCAARLRKREWSAVIVLSDNTRPVPYAGPSGILLPIVLSLADAGLPPANVTLLVASGTHRSPSENEIVSMPDDDLVQLGVKVCCHDAFDHQSLSSVGRTAVGTDVFVNTTYARADLKILPGLVESHFMAGASGGRKSICPGLLGIQSIREFHGPRVLAHPRARDLILAGNPCHELSLEIARMVPPDFIANARAREDGAITGVFAGEMESAQEPASEHVRSFVEIPPRERYDTVVTHGGRVGVNHYQVAKAAGVAARASRERGYVVAVADTVEPEPKGGECYQALMTLLKQIGPDSFGRLMQSDDWALVPDQWQVHMWSRVLRRIPWSQLFYYSPQTPLQSYSTLPCAHIDKLLSGPDGLNPSQQINVFMQRAVNLACERIVANLGTQPKIAYLPVGPYGIPVEGDGELAD